MRGHEDLAGGGVGGHEIGHFGEGVGDFNDEIGFIWCHYVVLWGLRYFDNNASSIPESETTFFIASSSILLLCLPNKASTILATSVFRSSTQSMNPR